MKGMEWKNDVYIYIHIYIKVMNGMMHACLYIYICVWISTMYVNFFHRNVGQPVLTVIGCHRHCCRSSNGTGISNSFL